MIATSEKAQNRMCRCSYKNINQLQHYVDSHGWDFGLQFPTFAYKDNDFPQEFLNVISTRWEFVGGGGTH
jgi:hypothetical protein